MKSVFTTLLLLSASMVYLCTALICPAVDFNADNDAKLMRQYTDPTDITKLLVSRSGEQRVQIAKAYEKLYNKKLVEAFESFAKNYWNILVVMVEPLSHTYAKELHESSKIFRTDARANVDIIATASNTLMRAIAQSYKTLFPENNNNLLDLFRRVDDYTDKGLEYKVIQAQFYGSRVESEEDDKKRLFRDCKNIYTYSQIQWRNPHKISRQRDDISQIFQRRSFDNLHKIIHEYEKTYNKPIEAPFQYETTKFDTSALNMINVHRSIPDYFARRLEESIKGSDKHLIRIIVGRSEIDLDAINVAFLKRYNKSLYSKIDDNISGDYRDMLLAIVNTTNQLCSSEYC